MASTWQQQTLTEGHMPHKTSFNVLVRAFRMLGATAGWDANASRRQLSRGSTASAKLFQASREKIRRFYTKVLGFLCTIVLRM